MDKIHYAIGVLIIAIIVGLALFVKTKSTNKVNPSLQKWIEKLTRKQAKLVEEQDSHDDHNSV